MKVCLKSWKILVWKIFLLSSNPNLWAKNSSNFLKPLLKHKQHSSLLLWWAINHPKTSISPFHLVASKANNVLTQQRAPASFFTGLYGNGIVQLKIEKLKLLMIIRCESTQKSIHAELRLLSRFDFAFSSFSWPFEFNHMKRVGKMFHLIFVTLMMDVTEEGMAARMVEFAGFCYFLR